MELLTVFVPAIVTVAGFYFVTGSIINDLLEKQPVEFPLTGSIILGAGIVLIVVRVAYERIVLDRHKSS